MWCVLTESRVFYVSILESLFDQCSIPVRFYIYSVACSCVPCLPYLYYWLCNGTPNVSWWRHQMEAFSALLTLCAGNSPVTGEFPAQRPVTRSYDVFFDLRLNERLSKQSWGWWFETLSCSLWRHINCTGSHEAANSLKRKCRHFDEILITGCTGSCQNDNFQCSQWLKIRQNDDIFVSV